jgi:hypothetical protein
VKHGPALPLIAMPLIQSAADTHIYYHTGSSCKQLHQLESFMIMSQDDPAPQRPAHKATPCAFNAVSRQNNSCCSQGEAWPCPAVNTMPPTLKAPLTHMKHSHTVCIATQQLLHLSRLSSLPWPSLPCAQNCCACCTSVTTQRPIDAFQRPRVWSTPKRNHSNGTLPPNLLLKASLHDLSTAITKNLACHAHCGAAAHR